MKEGWFRAIAVLAMVAVSACGGAGSTGDDADRVAADRLGSGGTAQQEHDARGWPLAGFDVTATGYNPFESRLSRSNIDGLDVEWVFDESVAGVPVAPIHATPVIDRHGNAYIGDFAGTFFAISSEGKLLWSFSADAPTPEVAALLAPNPPKSSPFLGGGAIASDRPYLVVGDANGRIYARDLKTGREVWTARGVDANPLGGVAGNSVTIVGDTVLVGLGSLENYALVLSAGGLRVDCCQHRGGVVALDLRTGRERWRYNAVDAASPLPPSVLPFVLGPSGADVWSQPTYDAKTNTAYISTGQNLSPTADGHSTQTSDAIIALDFRTGAPKWVHQFTADDVWAVGIENPRPVTGQLLDMDLGDAPKIYRLRNGRKVVGAGQKDGRFHVVDAKTGALVRTREVIAPRNDLGGFQTGGAFAYDTVFQHGMHATDGFSDCKEGMCPYQGFEGRVVALSADASGVRWSLAIPVSPLVGGLAVANHLVFFQSPVEEAVPLADPPLWALYAVDADSGAVRKRITFPGRAIGSPVVADGHVYVTNGNAALAAYGSAPKGALIRLGLDDDRHGRR